MKSYCCYWNKRASTKLCLWNFSGGSRLTGSEKEINDLKEASLLRGKTFHFWSPMLYVKTLLVAVSWRDKYTEAMSAHGYEEGATRSRKEHFVSAKVSLGLAILIIIFTNLFIFLT